GRIVDVLEHDVLERDSARIAEAGIVAAGVQQRGERILAVDWHDLVAQFVVHRVQRDCQIDVQLAAAALDHRYHAGGRQGYAPLGNGDAVAIHYDRHGWGDIFVIVERLAHAHQHDVG